MHLSYAHSYRDHAPSSVTCSGADTTLPLASGDLNSHPEHSAWRQLH